MTLTNYEIIAHRARNTLNDKENKLEGIIASFKEGATSVELDAAITNDGSIVLWHNKYICIGKRKIPLFKVSYDKICDYLDENQRPELLKKVVETFPDKQFVIELKDYNNPLETFFRIYEDFSLEKEPSKFKFLSSSLCVLNCIKNEDFRIYTIYLANGFGNIPITKNLILNAANTFVDEIASCWLFYNPCSITSTKDLGIEVGLGYIDTKISLNYAYNNKVNIFYTNKPKNLTFFLEEKLKKI